MIIKNYEIQALGEFLYELKLKGKESRMRSRMVALLETHLMQVNKEREVLVNDFAKKDEDGSIITEEYDGKTGYVLDNPQEYNREISMLMNEDFIIEETEDKLDMLRTVRDVVLCYDEEVSGDEAMKYDRFCEILEEVE